MPIQGRSKRRVLLLPIAAAIYFAGVVSAGAADKVTTVAVPAEGQPMAARTDASGVIHLVYKSSDGPQYVRSTDGAKTFSSPLPLVDQESRKPELEFYVWDLAVGPEGRVHLAMGTNAWKLKLPQEEWGFQYVRLDPGAGAFTPVRNINRKPSEGFSLAADERGRVTACWLSDKLYANVSEDGGKTFGSNIEIDPAFNPCDCCTTSAAYGADGKLAVLYREETDNRRDMYLVLWDQDRKTSSRTRVSTTLWTINACPMSYYAITRHRDGYVAVWPTKDEIYFARLDGKGNLQSPAEIKTPGKTGMRTGMLTLSAADGSTLVAWKKAGELGWQLYDARGKPSGPAESAKSAGDGVAGVLNAKGEFVLFR